jgi:hypothetical protein
MIILLPVLVCLIGLLMYALATNPKVNALGLNMFWVGLFVSLLQSSQFVIK